MTLLFVTDSHDLSLYYNRMIEKYKSEQVERILDPQSPFKTTQRELDQLGVARIKCMQMPVIELGSISIPEKKAIMVKDPSSEEVDKEDDVISRADVSGHD